jgi:hypothetical protein
MIKIQICVIVLFLLFFYPNIISTLPVSSNYLKVKQHEDLTTTKDKSFLINFTAASENNINKRLKFSISGYPTHGLLSPIKNITENKAITTYTPIKNYTGPDSFTFLATDAITNSNVGEISITINPAGSKLLLIAPPEQRAIVAFILSLVIVFLIFLLTYLFIRKIRLRQNKKYMPKFWDILRDENWYPSLAIFQFLLWTSVVLFSYLGIYLARLFSGSAPLLGIPPNLFAVMGISAAVTIVNGFVSQFKYGDTTPPNEASTKQVPPDTFRKRLPGYRTMIMENGKITLPRFQMFAWTWIGIISYLAFLFLETGLSLGNLEHVAVPELPILFVSLMGLSQVTYQSVKATTPAIFSVYEVRPRKIQLQNENNLVTILGSNFGTKGTIWIEYYPPLTEQEKIKTGYEDEYPAEYIYDPLRVQEQFKLDPEIPREDNRVVAKLDNIKDKLKLQSYVIRLEKNGLLT